MVPHTLMDCSLLIVLHKAAVTCLRHSLVVCDSHTSIESILKIDVHWSGIVLSIHCVYA